MKDKKQDYRKNPGFFSNIWDKTKAALKGSATPVKYTAAAAAGMWLGGTLLNFGLFENFIGNNNLGSLVQDAFWGNQLELVPFFSNFSFFPVGVIPSTIMGITALCSIPKAIKNYREYKHQHQKGRIAVRKRAIDLMEECLNSNQKYQQIKKQFDAQESEFQTIHNEYLEEKKSQWNEDDKKGVIREFIDKTLTSIPVVGGALAVAVDKGIDGLKGFFKPSVAEKIRKENNDFTMNSLTRQETLQNEFLNSLSPEEKQKILADFHKKQDQINWKGVRQNAEKMAENVKVPKKGRSLTEFKNEIKNQTNISYAKPYQKQTQTDIVDKKITISDPDELLKKSKQYTRKKDEKNYALAYKKNKENVA